jgi:hypothetical protein
MYKISNTVKNEEVGFHAPFALERFMKIFSGQPGAGN